MKLLAAAGLALAAASPEAVPHQLDMMAFFTGNTHADNVIRITLHGPHKLIVDSVGGKNKEGEFLLIDTVREEGKPVRKRIWVMHAVSPGHFTGTLSDAAGPVDVQIDGDSVTIRYTMSEGHLAIVQQMQLQADGRSLSNHAVAKRFGITFAHVDGTVRKLD